MRSIECGKNIRIIKNLITNKMKINRVTEKTDSRNKLRNKQNEKLMPRDETRKKKGKS